MLTPFDKFITTSRCARCWLQNAKSPYIKFQIHNTIITCFQFLSQFPYLPRSKVDYNMTGVNDNYSNQNIQGKVPNLTAGKMLGGSSQIQHNIRVYGAPSDYDAWAAAVNDPSWSYDGLLKYFKKSECLKDNPIRKEYGFYHGNNGPVVTQRQVDRLDKPIMDSFAELGYKIRIDTNNNDTLGVVEPLYDNDFYRQSGLISYIYPAKCRPNLHVLSNAMVTKIIFNKKNEAIGVKFSYQGRSYIAKSSKEVIISAGALKSPQLLMLSGVGPADHLREMKIPVIADLPVGKKLCDHVGVSIVIALEKDSSPTPAVNPSKFPTPLTCNYVNLDNKTADFAQIQGINLIFYQNNAGLMGLCLNVFKYSTDICQHWFDANVNRRVITLIVLITRPLSTGEVSLRTTSVFDQPIIDVGYFRNETDLTTLARGIGNSLELMNTTYFKKINATFYDLGLCSEHEKYSMEYLKCYAVAMSSTLWHVSGTASLGIVVDTHLAVKKVRNLRVIDASIMPALPGGNINSAVLALAEKGAADIMDKYGCSCSN